MGVLVVISFQFTSHSHPKQHLIHSILCLSMQCTPRHIIATGILLHQVVQDVLHHTLAGRHQHGLICQVNILTIEQ